jgi:hypothetical protein
MSTETVIALKALFERVKLSKQYVDSLEQELQ